MSSLTEEQLRRIEENRIKAEQLRRIDENRRRALELRAAAAAASSSSSNTPLVNRTNLVQPSGAGAQASASDRSYPVASSSTTTYATANQNLPQSGPAPRPPQSIQQANKAYQQKSAAATAATGTAAQLPFTGNGIMGRCSMISKERFKVEIAFHQQVIAIFKTIDGGQYDAESKTWSFPLTSLPKLMNAVEPLRPAVAVGSLPPSVLRVFRSRWGNQCSEDVLSKIDSVLVEALMPFQKDGVIFGISRNGKVLIADDMGLGKTIQALGIANYYYCEWPLLIVTPSSMRYAWREAIWNWLPSVPPGSICVMETSKDVITSSQVVIMSYDLMQRKCEDLGNFKVIIMDESHNLKNLKAARTKAAMPLLQAAKRAILLSGTPALSRPLELYPQLNAIAPKLFQYNEYGMRYCNGKKSNFGWDFSGSSNMQELSLILEETVMLRRLKTAVLQQLPPKLRKIVTLDKSQIKLTGAALRASAAAFNEAESKRMSQMEKRGRLLDFYSETAKVKLPAVCDYIRELVNSGKKIICFAHHQYMMQGISEALDAVHCAYIRIEGSTAPEARQYSVEQFQVRDDIRVALLSITAANTGITLTAANIVVFAELYWNPGILTQAEDRVHRIGQRDNVTIEYLIAQGTSDDVMWGKIKDKLDVLNKAGLSKDNFQDAEVNKSFAPASKLPSNATGSQSSQAKQSRMEDFFHPSEPVASNSTLDDSGQLDDLDEIMLTMDF